VAQKIDIYLNKNPLSFLRSYRPNDRLQHAYSVSVQDASFLGGSNTKDALDYVFDRFNTCPPPDYQGRSLSIGDVIRIDKSAFSVERQGFRQVEMGREQEANPESLAIHIASRSTYPVIAKESTAARETAAINYINNLFQRDDRVSLVLINPHDNRLEQRISLVEKVVEPKYQAWLRHMNAQDYNVYLGMNTIKPGSWGRKKEDIAEIRHVFLDFDEGGRQAVDRVVNRPEIPRPAYVLESSPGKHQVIWEAREFTMPQVEQLVSGLARESGADKAVWDAARVLRIPGFRNTKYADIQHYVTAEHIAGGIVKPDDFPERLYDRSKGYELERERPRQSGQLHERGGESERDFGIAIGMLKKGMSIQDVAQRIQDRRDQMTHDGGKPKARDYGMRTAVNAWKVVERERQPTHVPER
jgi:hypothetical protein